MAVIASTRRAISSGAEITEIANTIEAMTPPTTDHRYAGGELTREQYDTMKEELGLTDTKASNKGCC